MKFKKIISLFLSLLILLQCFSVFAYAVSQPAKYEQDGFTYVCFGDSYTRGMGCSDNWREETRLDYADYPHQRRNITGAYPYIVAQELMCDTETENGWLDEPDATYWPLIQNGQRVAGVLDFFGVEDNYYDSYFYHDPHRGHAKRYNRLVQYFGNPDSTYPTEDSTFNEYGSVYDARDLVASADLVTVQLGMADVFNRPVFAAAEEYLGGNLDFDGADTETIVKFAERVVENMYEGYEYFVRAYPILVEYLKGLTESGKCGSVALINVANPAFGLNVNSDILLPIGSAFSLFSNLVNKHIKECADKYGLLYIDISNVDTSINEFDWSFDEMFAGLSEVGTHPSPNGHKQIARLIIDAYKNQNRPVTKNIVVDLGRFDKVNYVLVDGKLLSADQFKVENNVLTIKNSVSDRKSMMVAVQKDKDVALTVYTLKYSSKEGYSAQRVYTTNSVMKIIMSIISFFKNIIASIKK